MAISPRGPLRSASRLISPSALSRAAGILLYLGVTLGPVASLGLNLLTRVTRGEFTIEIQPRTWHLLRNSLGLAVTASGLAAIVGWGTALWLASGQGRLSHLARKVFIAPLLIPPYVYALTWMGLLSRQGLLNRGLTALLGVYVSPYGFYATALVLSLVFFPVVALLALAALDSIDPEIIEAARIVGSDRRTWYRVVLPLTLPAVLAGVGLVFALTLVEYGVPALMQFNVYAMEIYADFSQSGDPVQAVGLALPLVVPAIILVVLSQSGWGQTPLRSRPNGCPALRDLARPSVLRFWTQVSSLTLVVGILIPVVVLLSQADWGRSIWYATTTAQREIRLSLRLALGAAVLTTLIALPTARILSRRRSGWLWALCALPLTMPAALFAIGLIHLWNRPIGVGIYGSPVMLLLAHLGRFLPFAVFALVTQFRQTDPLLHEAALLHPVGWHRRAVRVHLPLLAPGLIASAGIVFVLSLGELGASLLVVPPGSATLSLRLFNLLHYGASDSVAGLALVLLVLVGLAGGLTLSLVRRRHQ